MKVIFSIIFVFFLSNISLNIPRPKGGEILFENRASVMENISVTAYSDYGRTASGAITRHGMVACNFLKLGTKIKIPSIFGQKIFVVHDRMSKNYKKYPRNRRGLDVWMKSNKAARAFGVNRTSIIVLIGES